MSDEHIDWEGEESTDLEQRLRDLADQAKPLNIDDPLIVNLRDEVSNTNWDSFTPREQFLIRLLLRVGR